MHGAKKILLQLVPFSAKRKVARLTGLYRIPWNYRRIRIAQKCVKNYVTKSCIRQITLFMKKKSVHTPFLASVHIQNTHTYLVIQVLVKLKINTFAVNKSVLFKFPLQTL